MHTKARTYRGIPQADLIQNTPFATSNALQRAAVRPTPEPIDPEVETVSPPGLHIGTDFSQIPIRRHQENKTGLPDRLKAGIEGLSGLSMDDVRVHYNTVKPASIQALAYTQGSHIHLGSGQEKYLAHEVWHVVQQKQKRVQPTTQAQGIKINDDAALETDADLMGAKALSQGEIYLQKTRVPIAQTRNRETQLHPIHQSNFTQKLSTSVVQKVDDPNEMIYDTIIATHIKLYKKYKELSSIPKPSALRKDIKALISKAADAKGAYRGYAELIKKFFSGYTPEMLKALEKEAKDMATKTETDVATKKEGRKRELEDLQKLEQENEHASKKLQLPSEKFSVENYSDKQKAAIAEKLKDSKVQQKLFHASFKGYKSHASKSRATIQTRAKQNALTEDPKPLSTADMAKVQESYEHGSMGASLLLEQGKEYRVTMGRGGGQEIHQLGPYLPGEKTSVQEIMEEILNETKLKSHELAKAVEIRDPKNLEKWLEGKGVSSYYFGKIRALRHLLAVEKDRGPEVAAATSLTHRSAVHGYSHIADYPENTPLGPPSATTNIRKARKQQLTQETKKAEETPSSFGYIPDETVKRATASTAHFLNEFMKNPKLDPEASALVEAMLNEDETSDAPSDLLIAAMEGILRTPTYTGFGSAEFGKAEDSSSSIDLASKGGELPFIAPQDPMAPTIDHIDVFTRFVPDLFSNVTRLSHYEAKELFQLLGSDPVGKRVSLGGVTYTILSSTEQKTEPTDYNPSGLVLGFKVYQRGG